jgi:hypothetical protein
MKKYVVAGLALIVSLALAAVAIAANEYTIKVKPTTTKAGTLKKPVAIGLSYGFTTVDTNGQRPAALKALKIQSKGLRYNTNNFPGCSATSMQNAQSDDACPKGSLMGTGYANNRAGAQQDRSQQAIKCYLKLSWYNSKKNKAALFVESINTTDSSRSDFCPIPVATAIPISISKNKSGDTQSFTIPENLQHPGGTLVNSLVETKLVFSKKTKKVKGKTVGFLEAIGECVKGKKTTTTTFQHEDGLVKQSAQSKCTK